MEEQQTPKGKKPRLRSMKAMLAETIAELTAISQDTEQKPAKRSDAVMTKANLLASIYSTESEERKAKIKFADVEKLQRELEAARAEIARLTDLKAQAPAPPDRGETFEDKLKRHGIEEVRCSQG